MIIATVLDRMTLGDVELRVGAKQPDEARALTALDTVQDWMEAVIASEPKILQTDGTLTTTANQEYTTWPSGLMRLDALWYLDTSSTPNVPAFEVDLIQQTGGHRPSLAWPYSAVILPGTGTGVPREASPVGVSKINWSPVPNAVYTYRYYGFVAATSITVRTQTYAYPDHLSFAHAMFAAKLLRLSKDDAISDLESEAKGAFAPSIRALRKPVRVGPSPRTYGEIHST